VQTCENCGGPLGAGGGYPPRGYTTANSDPQDAWCETCAIGPSEPSEGELERIADRVGVPRWEQFS
jgi:hypothetical protein